MAILKRAQLETMGLLVIVVLIVFIAIFAIRLAMLSSAPANNDLKSSIIANNLLTSLSKVTICEGQQLSNIVKNCYASKPSCNQDSCQLLSEKLAEIMPKTGLNSREYKISIKNADRELLSLGQCSSNIISSSPYTIYTDKGSAIFRVYICY